jgi:hypothetical protein
MSRSGVSVFCVAFILAVFFLAQFSWSAHSVGEPALEKLPIWRQCCQEQDCVPEQVKMLGKDNNGMIPVDIEGVKTTVAKEKFSAVPSPHTWVCYYKLNGEIKDDNIRCILYPQQSGTTKSWQKNRQQLSKAEIVPPRGL